MKRIFKSIFVFGLAFLLTFSNILLCSANSAPLHWDGVTSTGSVVTGDNCPIIVEKELLTFDISVLPPDPFQEYNGEPVDPAGVTAEYHFYNPTDTEVTATLVFPFGAMPSTDSDGDVYVSDVEKFGITSNGIAVEKTIRYTYNPYYVHSHDFSIDDDIRYICDEYIKDDFFSPQTCVTVYKYKLNASKDGNYRFKTAMECYSENTRFFVNERYGGITKGGKDVELEVSLNTNSEDTFEIVFFGKAPDGNFDWTLTFSENFTDRNATLLFVAAETEIMTFEEYVFRSYDADSGILRHDWYNAALSYYIEDPEDCELGGRFESDFTDKLFRWYEYDLTFEPGERLTNVVTAPIYPSVDGTYTPYVYTYTYLLSPAKKWADFCSLDITINTPLYLTDSAVPGFSKTENGYTASFDKLPENELVFCLSESEDPEEANGGFLYGIFFIFLSILSFLFSGSLSAVSVMIALVLIVAGAITLIITLKKKRKNNKK